MSLGREMDWGSRIVKKGEGLGERDRSRDGK